MAQGMWDRVRGWLRIEPSFNDRRDKPRTNAREGTRVLIVDDSPTIVALLRKPLTRCGHRVRLAYDGEQAIVAAPEFRPDLIFLDIVLPGMNGFAALRALRRELDGAREVIGIGIGVPGGVDETTGFLHFAPNLGWRDVALGALLEGALVDSALAGVPLFVQNEADVAALGELEFDTGTASDPLLYVSINHGVGAGVIVGDRLLIGNRGFAGEIGHTILQPDGPPCSCGRRGCAEALIGVRAMLPARSRAATRRHAAPIAGIARRLAAHDPDTVQAVERAGGHLGTLLQNLAAAYDPACIVLGGAGVDLGDAFIEPALRTLGDYCAAASLPVPVVRLSQRGADAVAIGAAALVRYRLTRPLIAAIERHAVRGDQ